MVCILEATYYGRRVLNNHNVAAAQGAVSQARALGGIIGLSIATVVLNNKLSTCLTGVLDPARVQSLEESLNDISTLNPDDQALVAQAYTDAFNSQMRICTYLSAVALLAAIATYQKNPASVARLKEKQRAMAAEDLSEVDKELASTVGATPVSAKSYEL